jgi:serine phosphatase RsbU (regulator of sigma subunit)/pSer/pThr/pTyr-binding forkhead associated (FHA) protein
MGNMPEDNDLRSYLLIDGSKSMEGALTHFPFTIGRRSDNDLVISHPSVSRLHAQIVEQDGGFHILDRGSREGTFVNGDLLQNSHLLKQTDSIHFGSMRGPVMVFRNPERDSPSSIRELLEQMPDTGTSSSGLEKLRWFVESARRLYATGTLDQILSALLETTLQLTGAERAYVFLRESNGELKLALGRGRAGEHLSDKSTISRHAIARATGASSDFIVTDTLELAEHRSESIVAHNIRSIICLALRCVRETSPSRQRELLGVLYLDSRTSTRSLSEIDHNLLQAIAADAAALIDNAQMAVAVENGRHNREELAIAAQIQRSLMAIKLPTLPFAVVSARYLPCRDVGGDFYDVSVDSGSISIVLADVSGKGIPAALLASTLQGMIFSQLAARQPLAEIAATVNRFLRDKAIDKYATMSLLKLNSAGTLEYINCGHIPPVVEHDGSLWRLAENNMPVGLDPAATYRSSAVQLEPGTRVVLVTDGITETRDANGEFFEEDRLEAAILRGANLDAILEAAEAFAGSPTAEDDRTILEIVYTGEK